MNYCENLGWIDEYVRNVSPFIYVREEDSILIKIPNEAYKINAQGIKILKHIISGKSVNDILEAYGGSQEVARDIHNFFCDLKAILKGCYHERSERRAVEKIAFEIPYNLLPVLSEIAITYRCNLNCRFCYSSCNCFKNETSVELSTSKIKEILSIIKNEAMVPSVSFTGGEPALREDLADLVKHAKSLGMWTNLITNGTLISDDLARSLKDSGLDSAQVSLEAGGGMLHDKIVGAKGSFASTVNGIKNFLKQGMRVHTNTTINMLNKDELNDIVIFIKDLGLDKLSMNMIMPQGSALKSPEKINISYSQIGGIVLSVKEFCQKAGIEFMWYSPTPICIFNPIVEGLGNKGCAACDGLLSIAPNGDILPCSSYFKPLANILEATGRFKEVWTREEFAYFKNKKFAPALCQKCENLAVCNGACPLYWGQFGSDELLKVEKEVCR